MCGFYFCFCSSLSYTNLDISILYVHVGVRDLWQHIYSFCTWTLWTYCGWRTTSTVPGKLVQWHLCDGGYFSACCSSFSHIYCRRVRGWCFNTAPSSGPTSTATTAFCCRGNALTLYWAIMNISGNRAAASSSAVSRQWWQIFLVEDCSCVGLQARGYSALLHLDLPRLNRLRCN